MHLRNLGEIVADREPVILPQTDSVEEACRRMRSRRAGVALVIGSRRQLVGVFTGRDAVGRVLAEGRDAAATKLSDVMTPNPRTMPPEAMAVDALRLMDDGGFRHVPVVDGDQVLGVVSRDDFRGEEQARLDEDTRLKERIW